jgi:AcrR family transcriptional regulator
VESTATRRPGGRSERVRIAVFTATIDHLLAQGIDGLSIADVARQAQVHETSIYRRWRTKANLCVSAVLSRTNAELSPPDTGSLRGDLVALLLDIAQFVSSPTGGLLIQLALRQDMPEYEAARESFRAERFKAGMAVLEHGARRGELRAGVDPRLVLEALIGPMHLRLLLTREPLTQDFIEAVIDLVLPGILESGTKVPTRETAQRSG